MTTSRLMTLAVFALGVLMVIVGLYSVNYGLPIVRMEMGWTAVVAGSVAASAGGVVLAVGVLIGHVLAIRAAIERLAEPAFQMPTAAPMGESFGGEAADQPEAERRFDAPPLDLRPLHPLAPAARRETGTPAAEVRPEPALAVLLHPVEETEMPPPPPAPVVHHQPEPIIAEGAPALAHAGEDEANRASPPIPAPDPVVDAVADAPVSAPKGSNFLSSILSRRSGWTQEARRAPAATVEAALPRVEDHLQEPLRTSIDLSSGWERDEAPATQETELGVKAEEPPTAPAEDLAPEPPEHPEALTAAEEDPVASPEPEPELLARDPLAEDAPSMIETPAPPPDEPPAPVVVGRYNAGSASYVMYSNGMIEVETEHGTHQFASMQELKRFIEKRDSRVS